MLEFSKEIEQKHLEGLINHSFNQALGAVRYKAQELLPWVGYLEKYKEQSHQANHSEREKQREKVYYSEVLPKCSKIKDWQKEMNYLVKKNK